MSKWKNYDHALLRAIAIAQDGDKYERTFDCLWRVMVRDFEGTNERTTDRALQRLRKRGLIKFNTKNGWEVCEP